MCLVYGVPASIEVEVRSLQERLQKLRKNQMVIGKIAKINYEKDNFSVVKSAQIILSDGTPAFVFADSIPPHQLKVEEKLEFVIEQLNPDDGYLRLVSVATCKSRFEMDIKRLEEAITRRADKLMGLKEALDRRAGHLARAKEVLTKNYEQERNARTSEHRLRVQSWINEKKSQIAKLTDDIADIKSKISGLESEVSDLKGKIILLRS